MTEDEVIDLLSLIAAFDQRTVGRADVQAWHTIAVEARWTWPLARRAVLDYHRSGGDKPRIRPAHVTDILSDLRRTAARLLFVEDINPPRELADDPRAEIEWRRTYVRDQVDQALHAWAEGKPLPRGEPEARQVGPVDPRIRELVAKKSIPVEDAPP